MSVPLQDFYRALFPQNLVGRGSCTVGDKRLLYFDVNIYCTVVLLNGNAILLLLFVYRASGILGADDPFGDVRNSMFSFPFT